MKRNQLAALFAATVMIASGCGSDSKDPVSSDPGLTETEGPSTTFTHRVLFSLTEGSVSPIYAADASGANRQQLTSGRLDRQPQGCGQRSRR